MDALTLALVLFALMLVLMALRVPIAAAMFFAGVVGYALLKLRVGVGPAQAEQ